jgi:hypothetical protein
MDGGWRIIVFRILFVIIQTYHVRSTDKNLDPDYRPPVPQICLATALRITLPNTEKDGQGRGRRFTIMQQEKPVS